MSNLKEYHKLQLRVSEYEFNQFKKAKDDYGLSVRAVLETSGRPCQCCANTDVIVFNRQNDAVKIKRGILCKKR